MNKKWLFLFSVLVAIFIAIHNKQKASTYARSTGKSGWQTFEKISNIEIANHSTTPSELKSAHLLTNKRSLASTDDKVSFEKEALAAGNFQLRENRVLIGDIQKANYENENVELPMLNKINEHWNDILGNDLLRFQEKETKVLIKEEFPIIKISDGKGQYLEQVIITYVLKNGDQNSYRALVDSESGLVVETWDRTVHEKIKPEKIDLGLPVDNNSGIITK